MPRKDKGPPRWEGATTVMIRNVAPKVSQDALRQELHVRGFTYPRYDFFYLPMNATKDANAGYAFVNFRDTEVVRQFVEQFDGLQLPRFPARRRLQVVPASVQGYEANLAHFAHSAVLNHHDPSHAPLFLRDRTQVREKRVRKRDARPYLLPPPRQMRYDPAQGLGMPMGLGMGMGMGGVGYEWCVPYYPLFNTESPSPVGPEWEGCGATVVVHPVTGAVAEALAQEVTPGHTGRGEIQWANEVDFVHAEAEEERVTLHFRHAHVAVAFQLVFQGAELAAGAKPLDVELVTSGAWNGEDKASKARAPLPNGPPPPPPLELWEDDEKPPVTPSKEGLGTVSPGSTRASTTHSGTPSWSLPSTTAGQPQVPFKLEHFAQLRKDAEEGQLDSLLAHLAEPAPLPL